jgi:hypothetical protein
MWNAATWKRGLRRLWEKLSGFFTRSPVFPPPADPALLREIKGWFAEHLSKHPEIPMERRGEYARAAGVIFERITPTALVRLVQNVREIKFHLTLEDMTADLARTHGLVATRLAMGRPVGGAYVHALRQLHLDGGEEDRHIVELYAHEFGHALNGPDRQISSSRAWREAWDQELHSNDLSPLAGTNPHEGFAEFARFLYSGTVGKRDLERRFPLCVRIWREQSLW